MEAKELKLRIEQSGLKKTFIAKKLNVSNALITQWITGNRPIAERHILELKRLLR